MHKNRAAMQYEVAALGLALALAGCPRREPVSAPLSPPPPVSAGPKVALPDGGLRHTERLAVVGWDAGGAFWACARRAEEFAPGAAEKIGRCVVVAAPGAEAKAAAFAPGAFTRDVSPPDAAPGRCRVLHEDIPGDPGLPPEAAARATLVGPGARAPIDAWRPPLSVDGDYFALETSFSPGGDWLAIVRTAVGRGEGEQSADVVAASVLVAPRCE